MPCYWLWLYTSRCANSGNRSTFFSKSLPIMFYFFENWIRWIPQLSFASGTNEVSFLSDTSDWMPFCWWNFQENLIFRTATQRLPFFRGSERTRSWRATEEMRNLFLRVCAICLNTRTNDYSIPFLFYCSRKIETWFKHSLLKRKTFWFDGRVC
jgi:hypothetical protein